MRFKIPVKIELDDDVLDVEVTPLRPIDLLTKDYEKINTLSKKEEPTIKEQIDLAETTNRFYKELFEKRCQCTMDTWQKIEAYVDEYGAWAEAYSELNSLYEDAKKNS